MIQKLALELQIKQVKTSLSPSDLFTAGQYSHHNTDHLLILVQIITFDYGSFPAPDRKRLRLEIQKIYSLISDLDQVLE